jgi:hypothetical protein
MIQNHRRFVVPALWLLLGLTVGVTVAQSRSALAESSGMGSNGMVVGPRYSVVETQASNLLVTDNRSNTVYFYTVDRGKSAGSTLRLRGSIDLNRVGQPSITPQRRQ